MPVALHVKLKSHQTPIGPIGQIVDSFSGAEMSPLFPNDEDAELACLYSVKVPNEKDGRLLMKQLQSSNLVEYVEATPKRKLAR